MEFMDRRNKSLPVQFWLTVDTFKDPLEEVDSEAEDVEDDEDDDVLGAGITNLPSASANIRGDMTMVYELYFSNPVSLSRLPEISPVYIETVRSFVLDQSSAPSTAARERRVRNSVLLAQKQVERAMEEDFQDFEKSELWFKVMADFETQTKKSVSAGKAAPESSPTSPKPFLPSGPAMPQSSLRPKLEPRARTGIRPTFIVPPKPVRTETSPLFSSASTSTASLPRSDSTQSPSSSTSTLPPPKRTNSGLTRPRAGSSANPLAFLTSSDSVVSETSRAPLFRPPLFDDDTAGDDSVQQDTIDALQAALTDMIANENEDTRPRSMSVGSDVSLSLSQTSLSTDLDSRRYSHRHSRSSEVFDDDDEGDAGQETHDIGLAGPGDLQLSSEIDRLNSKIENLQAQESLLDALIRKAELTGDAQESKILRRSKSALTREARELTFQKSQYEQQEADNRLVPGRTKVSITDSVVSGDDVGKQVVRYLVEVRQLGPEGTDLSGWVVTRRYNEFWNLHQRLRERFVACRNLDFPPKKLVTSLSNSFVDTRRSALEKYMQVRIIDQSSSEVADSHKSGARRVTPRLQLRGAPGFSLKGSGVRCSRH